MCLAAVVAIVAVGMWATPLRVVHMSTATRRAPVLWMTRFGDLVLPPVIRRRAEVEEFQSALQRGQHAGEDFQPQIFLVAQAVGAALDHPDFVVKSFDEAERD